MFEEKDSYKFWDLLALRRTSSRRFALRTINVLILKPWDQVFNLLLFLMIKIISQKIVDGQLL